MRFSSFLKTCKKIPINFLVIFGSIFLISILSYFKLFSSFELLTYDWRLNLRPQIKTSQDIVVIEIDDYTLEKLGTWPIPRTYHALMLEALKSFKVKAVVFDILFSEKSQPDTDALFLEALKETNFVYLPLVFNIEGNIRKDFMPIKSKELSVDILADFKKYIKGTGHINTFVDIDGKIRGVPIFVEYKNEIVPHISLRLASDFLGLDLKKVEFKNHKIIIDKKLSIPVSSSNMFMINYPGRWKTTFKHFSYLQILKAYSDFLDGIKPSIDVNFFKDKICFIGLTATGTGDLKPMPFENLYPMLGVHPSIFNSIITKNFIVRINYFFDILINILVFLIAFLICKKQPPLKALFSLAIFSLIYILISTVSLIFFGIWIVLFFPLLIISITYVIFTIYNFLEEFHKRKLLEKELDIARKIQESFLPKGVEKMQDLSISMLMQPAKFVAGDLYDIFALDGKRVSIFIGDVSGKGASAALIMAQTISLFRIFSRLTDNPAIVLNNINKELCKVLEGRFVTAFYVIIDISKNIFLASCAGHLPLIMYKAADNKAVKICPVWGPPIGVLEDVEYETFSENFNKKDRLLFYTDGITEARSKKEEEFGEERLLELFFKYKEFSVQEAQANILKELAIFSKGLPQHDDITLIILEHL